MDIFGRVGHGLKTSFSGLRRGACTAQTFLAPLQYQVADFLCTNLLTYYAANVVKIRRFILNDDYNILPEFRNHSEFLLRINGTKTHVYVTVVDITILSKVSIYI